MRAELRLDVGGDIHLPPKKHEAKDCGKLVATYDYVDESGALVSQTFSIRKARDRRGEAVQDVSANAGRTPARAGAWIWNLRDNCVVPYRPVRHIRSDCASIDVFLSSRGRKPLRSCGLSVFRRHAIRWARGSGRPASPRTSLRRCCLVPPDNDDPGRKHAEQVARNLHGVAAAVSAIELPGLGEKDDVVEWLDLHGGTADRLHEIADVTPGFNPGAPATSRDLVRLA